VLSLEERIAPHLEALTDDEHITQEEESTNSDPSEIVADDNA
jgi:hypothetical protein